MQTDTEKRQPGDLILDRCMTDASAEEREAAREALRAYAVIVVGIAKRVAADGGIEPGGKFVDDVVDLEKRPPPPL